MSGFFDSYRGKQILITGHTGFKGSWLAIWLEELGARVSGIALDPHTSPSLFMEAGLAEHLEDYRCDIRDYDELYSLVSRIEPELVFHLAAQPIVRESYSAARETFETNVQGSVNVFECVQRVKSVKALVHVSTDKCYEPRDTQHGHRESDPLGGVDPYSASKAAAEIAFFSYSRSLFGGEHGVLAASGRAGNVVGGGDWAVDRIIPDAVRALSTDQTVPVRNPLAIRPWQHVLEALSGYLTLGSRLLGGDEAAAGAWNFGPGTGHIKTVEDLVNTLITVWGGGSWERKSEFNAPRETARLVLCNEKAQEQLGWKCRWSFEKTLRHTALWYKDFYSGSAARDLCLRDIQDFCRLASGENHGI